MESSCNNPSGPLIQSFGWKTILELIDEQSKVMVYKSIYGLAPEYLQNFFIRNSTCSSYTLQNTTTDFKIPKKNQPMVKNLCRIEVRDFGIAYQIRQCSHLPYVLSRTLPNGLGIILVVGR